MKLEEDSDPRSLDPESHVLTTNPPAKSTALTYALIIETSYHPNWQRWLKCDLKGSFNNYITNEGKQG